jgi:hypothetical protein
MSSRFFAPVLTLHSLMSTEDYILAARVYQNLLLDMYPW